MLEKIRFAAEIDVPLVVVVTLAFLINFQFWAKKQDAETDVNLKEKLPSARLRLICFFLALLAFCWYSKLAFSAILGLLFLVGFVAAVILRSEDGFAVVVAAAYVIREWSFGFPQMKLHPLDESSIKEKEKVPDSMVGTCGVTLSQLRPSGEAEFNGQTHRVKSDDGALIETGTRVVVVDRRNGVLCVKKEDRETQASQ